MIEYPKIPNIFIREQYGKNRLIEGKYTSDELEYLDLNYWIGTEKVDGTNIRVCWDGYSVGFRGRTDKAQIPKQLLERLQELFGGTEKEELFEQTFGKKEVILFGEGYGGKIQNGGKYGTEDFILFDVLCDGYWLKRDNIYGIAGIFDLKTVPVVFRGSLEDAVEFIRKHPKSRLKDEAMEGIVCVPQTQLYTRNGERIIVKIKCRDFEEETT